MNTRQLICALDSDPMMRDFHREVYALDQFQKAKLENKGIYICNEQSSRESGSHWFLIFIDRSREKDFIIKEIAFWIIRYYTKPFLDTLWRILFVFCLSFI